MGEPKIYSAELEQWIINHNGVLTESKVSERCTSKSLSGVGLYRMYRCLLGFFYYYYFVCFEKRSYFLLKYFLKKEKPITLISLNCGIQKDFGGHLIYFFDPECSVPDALTSVQSRLKFIQSKQFDPLSNSFHCYEFFSLMFN